MTKSEIVRLLAAHFDCSAAHARDGLETLLQSWTEELAAGNAVRLQNFGSLQTYVRPARSVKTPGQPLRYAPSKTAVRFVVSDSLLSILPSPK